MRRYRYARWDGTQTPIGEDVTVEKLVENLSEDILEGLGPEAALNRIMQQGVPGQFMGLRGLLEKLKRARQQQQQGGRLDGWLEQIRDELDGILDTERAHLMTDEDPEARLKESYLGSLPQSAAGQLNDLKNYDWSSPEARQRFHDLMEQLRQQMLESYMRNLSQGMRTMTPEQKQRMKDMLAALNGMLAERAAGTGPTQERFDAFMREFGDFFPEAPRTLDELLEAMARRAAALSRLMASLSPEQRAELEALSREMLEDLDLAFEMDRLMGSLRGLMPNMPWDEPTGMDGEDALGLAEGLDAIERMSDYEQLEDALRSDRPGASLEDIDVDKLRRTLGEDAVRDVERLKRVERALEEAGIVSRRGGQLQLTPRGIRKLGERALARVFERLVADRPGSHDAREAGGGGEPTGQTRPWRWGDQEPIDVQRTLHNAIAREGMRDGRVHLKPQDFEVAEAETRTTAATVLLLDMSFSMPMRGNWVPAKRMALALHSLISSKYPEDHLSIVGFSAIAHEMKPQDLVDVGWEHVYGTNMQHAFNLANRILSKHRGATKQVLLVTDGEPTAHLTDDGEVFFHWPPVRETLEKTYKEAMRLQKAGITMNIFMLEDTPNLFRFVDQLAKVVSGRVFAVQGDDLGDLILRDYLKRKSG